MAGGAMAPGLAPAKEGPKHPRIQKRLGPNGGAGQAAGGTIKMRPGVERLTAKKLLRQPIGLADAALPLNIEIMTLRRPSACAHASFSSSSCWVYPSSFLWGAVARGLHASRAFTTPARGPAAITNLDPPLFPKQHGRIPKRIASGTTSSYFYLPVQLSAPKLKPATAPKSAARSRARRNLASAARALRRDGSPVAQKRQEMQENAKKENAGNCRRGWEMAMFTF